MTRRISFAWGAGSIAMAALALAANPVLIVITAAISGFFATTCVINTQTYVQLTTPDALRGRVLSVQGVVLRASPALGALVAGYAIDRIGLTAPVLVACATSLAVAIIAFVQQGKTPAKT